MTIMPHTPGCTASQHYLISLLFTFTFWQGNLFIINWCRRHYPGYQHTTRRIIMQGIGAVILTLVGTIILENSISLWINDRWGEWVNIGNGIKTTLIITVGVVSIYESSYFFGQWRRSTLEAQKLLEANLKAQLSLLKQQITPHFLFNNFNTLAAVIEEDPKTAQRMVLELAQFYRYVLQAEGRDTVPLAEEVESLKNYAWLMQLRHDESLNVQIDIADYHLDARIPPLTLQMLLENALKHNGLSAREPLTVSFKANGTPYLEVRNTKAIRSRTLPSTGLGLRNLKERFSLLGLGRLAVYEDADSFSVTLPLKA